ncbi:hypothetical protein AMJ57_04400 [Parcubacteria bacterium SG8_24]|nr:MAG: hypothetical protein AMJ57_04400 [Parcubacteria bacterium SG8_24]
MRYRETRLSIALPVLNEAGVLERSVGRLVDRLRSDLADFDTTVIIADNGSDDRTPELGRGLAELHPEVVYLEVAGRGKGLAIRRAWETAEADIYAFMDIDLSTDLAALRPLTEAVAGGAALALGSRRRSGAEVERSRGRLFLSWCYRQLLRLVFRTAVSDAACGFKAVSAEVVRQVLPEVRDSRWFFDTELVLRAEHAGFGIKEIPLRWREQAAGDRRSKVNVIKVAWEYLKQVVRLRRELT